MFNPFEPFKPLYIEGLAKAGQLYLVTQTFTRNPQHFDDVKKEQILVSEYDDLGIAKVHFKALKGDNYRSIIHLNKTEHAHKLLSMVQPDSKYQVWWNIVKKREEVERRMNTKYASHQRRWIAKNTNWYIPVDKVFTPSMQIIFGEVFLTLTYGSQTKQVKFDEVEKS